MIARFQPILMAFLLLGGGGLAKAQEPFATDIVPTFSYEEQYTEGLRTVDGETIEQLQNTIRIDQVRLSLAGVDIGSFTAATPYSIEMGDLTLAGVLGDDPTFAPGKRTATIAIMGSNWLTGAAEKVGDLIFTWSEAELNFTVNIEAVEEAFTNTFSPLAWYFWDWEDDAIEEEMDLIVRFGNRTLEDRKIYASGTASYAEVVTLEDAWDLSRVRLTGAIDSRSPTVTIQTPTVLSAVYTPTTTISGTAADNASGIAQVLVQVNGGPWQVASGFEIWSVTTPPLKLGRNVVRAKAIDEVGLESIIDSRTFIYSRQPPLQVSVNGSGVVSKGFLGITYRKIGSVVSVAAAPALGHRFTGWTGDFTSADPRITFVMPSAPVAIQAQFVPGPYVQTTGWYAGGFLSGTTGWRAGGSALLAVNPAGALSGKIFIGGKGYGFKGAFDETGRFEKVLALATPKSPRITLLLQVDTAQFGGAIAGSVDIDGQVVPFTLGQSKWDAKLRPAPQAGTYTLVLPPEVPSPGNAPEGDGFGLIRVGLNGLASGVIYLPDGSKVAVQSFVSDRGELPLAGRVAGKLAAVSGLMTFADIPGATDLHGPLLWQKDPMIRELAYPDGFLTTLPVAGSKFVRPLTVPDFFPGGSAAPVVTIGAGPLDATRLVKTLSVSPRGVVTVVDPGADQLQVKYLFSQGLFTGSFRDPASGALRRFTGALLQKQNLAGGYFFGNGETGFVRIDARP
ncbi:MAG: hypothetical protein JNK37_16680 [Verrucomicrobiales bacterium]|nr:hypothetical protein [Verrucomicrobiales bacterium]